MHGERGGYLRLVDPVERPDGVRFRSHDTVREVPQPSIWVVSLPDLQAGTNHGTWLAADQSEAALNEGIQRMLRRSPIGRRNGRSVEDWAIAAQRDFGAFKLSAFDDLAWVSAVAGGIVKYGEAFAAWAPHQESTDALDAFVDVFLGEHRSLAAFGQSQIEALGMDRQLRQSIPNHLRRHTRIDASLLARDLVNSGAAWVHPSGDGGLWAYRGTDPRPTSADVVE